MTYELTGLDGCVAIVTGAGRMRSIGRPIAVELARAGCDIIITGTGRSPENYPPGENEAGWRDIASVAEEIEALGRRALPVVSDIADRSMSMLRLPTHFSLTLAEHICIAQTILPIGNIFWDCR